MLQIDLAMLTDAGANHRAGFRECLELGSLQTWQILPLIVRGINVIVEIKEVARHAAKNAATRETFLRLFQSFGWQP